MEYCQKHTGRTALWGHVGEIRLELRVHVACDSD